MQLTALSLALTRVGLGGFAPSSLFLYGEQGVWYEPSLTNGTCFQDAAGTTPVTAVEQPVGLILDKSKGLVLGPELVTNGDFSNGTTGWTAVLGSISAVGGVLRVARAAASVGRASSNQLTCVPGRMYTVSLVRSKAQTGTTSVAVSTSATSTTGAIYTSNTAVDGLFQFFFTATQAQHWLFVETGSGTEGQYSEFDNISVRELPGNHAFQTTTTSRPVLSARYNLLTKTEQFDDAAWTKSNVTITANTIVAPDGTLTADKFIPSAGVGNATVSQPISVAVAPYTYTFRAKAAEQSSVSLVSNLTGTFRANVFNLSAQTASPGTGWTASITPDPEGGGWFICSCSATADTAASKSFQISNNSAGWTGDGTSGIYIWGASLTPANQASLPYQRVNTATDYDADPAKFPVYLRFDGIDDWLQTNSIDFTATDKMTVFAGVTKLSDAARGIVVELGNGAVPGSDFNMNAPPSASPGYGFRSRGTSIAGADLYTGFPAPTTDVLTGIGDISGDQVALRVDGTQVASSTADQGTGSYGNYPLYIGRRGGTTLPFNGQLYSLIVRGAQTSTTQIAQTETWVNGKTKAY